MEGKIDLWCTGQIADARSYLMKLDDYPAEKVAMMSDKAVGNAIDEIVEANDYHVISDNGSEDIGLIPDEAWHQITWFRR